MLVACADASWSVGIQVKTNQGSKKVWLLDKKSEDSSTENLIYVFVNLNDSNQPSFHVVPSQVVADYTRGRHQTWLAGKSKHGRIRKDSSMRKFADADGTYLDAWHYLPTTIRAASPSK